MPINVFSSPPPLARASSTPAVRHHHHLTFVTIDEPPSASYASHRVACPAPPDGSSVARRWCAILCVCLSVSYECHHAYAFARNGLGNILPLWGAATVLHVTVKVTVTWCSASVVARAATLKLNEHSAAALSDSMDARCWPKVLFACAGSRYRSLHMAISKTWWARGSGLPSPIIILSSGTSSM